MKPILKKIFFGVLCALILIVMFCPQLHYRVGNVFFGGVPVLYNVNLAQYFFLYAAYPIVGKAPSYAHHQLSRTYFIQGQLPISVNEALKEMEIYPENVRTNYILGLTYGYMNREVEAIEAFSKFIKANPTSWAARNDKAWLQFRIGEVEGALATIEPVSQVMNPWVQNTYGTLLLNLERKEEAKQAFLKAKELVEAMSPESWGIAYPGNDPRIYETGLSAMKSSIAANLAILE
jgi:tetratricopeptide (TPR) repeat protein